MMRRAVSVGLMIACALAQGCVYHQHITQRWAHHPNRLIAMPSMIGTVIGGVSWIVGDMPILLVAYPLSMPFGKQEAVKAALTSDKSISAVTVPTTYLAGAPFYAVFGWWGPGNMSTKELREVTSEANGRLQFLHCYRIYGSDLKGADLSNLDLAACDLSGVDFSGANLSHTRLTCANLRGAKFIGANLTGASMERAYLSRADFTKANLTGVNFSGRDEASLYPTVLSDVNWNEANVAGATFKRVTGLDKDAFHRAQNCEKAQLQ